MEEQGIVLLLLYLFIPLYVYEYSVSELYMCHVPQRQEERDRQPGRGYKWL